MTSKRATPEFAKFIRGESQDLDVQAGSRGITTAQAAKAYLKNPGHFLAVLRLVTDSDVETVATGTGIPAETLSKYEKGAAQPTLQELTRIAKHYGADLRVLLEVFGHVSDDAAEESMGLAAHFSGTLTHQEKLDLRRLFEAFKSTSKDE